LEGVNLLARRQQMFVDLVTGVFEHSLRKETVGAFVGRELHSVQCGFTLGHWGLPELTVEGQSAPLRKVASLAVSRAPRYANRR
jgi:hypothetical protein